MIDASTGNVEVAVYLTDPVNPDTVKPLTNKLEGLPAVADVQYESKEEACARRPDLFRDQPTFIENVDCATLFPASLRVKLADTAQFAQVRAIVEGQPGIGEIARPPGSPTASSPSRACCRWGYYRSPSSCWRRPSR